MSKVPSKLWNPVLESWKSRFSVFRDSLPLDRDIRRQMVAAGVFDSSDRVHVHAFIRHTESSEYHEQVAVTHLRYNLDGSVSHHRSHPSEQTRAALRVRTIQPVNCGVLRVRAVATNFADYLDVPTTGLKSLHIEFRTQTGSLSTMLGAKTLRRAQDEYSRLHGQCVVTIVGELDLKTMKLTSTGIIVNALKKASRGKSGVGECS